MVEKQIYLKVTSGYTCSKEEYIIAYNYYLTANEEEKTIFKEFKKRIGKNLLNFQMQKENTKYKMFLKRHGLDSMDGIDFIGYFITSTTLKDEEQVLMYITLKYGNADLFLKELYTLCQNSLWSKNELMHIAKNYELNYEILIYLLKLYMSKYLGLNEEEINEKELEIESYEAFINFLQFELTSLKEYKQVLWYLNNKASLAEKDLYSKVYLSIGHEAYMMAQPEAGNIAVYNFLTSKYHMPAKAIKNACYEYKKTKNIDNSFKQENNQKSKQELEAIEQNKYYQVCKLFLNSSSNNELEEFILLNKIDIKYLSRHYTNQFLDVYCATHPEADKLKTKEILLTNLKKYVMYARNKRRVYKYQIREKEYTEKEIFQAKYVITKLVHLSSGTEEYISSFRTEDMSNYINAIRKHDLKLYELYYAKTNRGQYLSRESILELIYYLKNGIKENDSVRTFDIIDYYLIFKEPLYILKKQLNFLPIDSQTLVNNFITENHLTMVSKEELQFTNRQMNCEKDKNDFPIPNAGMMISLDESELILNYLIDSDIPLSEKIYHLAIQKYLEGTLLIEKTSIRK